MFKRLTQHNSTLKPSKCHFAVVSVGRQDKFIAAACFLTAVAGESEDVKRLRALRLMALVREDSRAELWNQVSHYFVCGGWLNMSEVFTSNLTDLVFLLS